MSIIIFGTSITWGAWDIEQGGWAERFGQIVNQRVVESNFAYWTETYCLGVSGNTSHDILSRLEREILSRKWDEDNLVIVEVGINDALYNLQTKTCAVDAADFKNNITKIRDICRENECQLVLIGPVPVDEGKVNLIPWLPEQAYRMKEVTLYNDILKKFGRTHDIQVIDLLESIDIKIFKKHLLDGVHPDSKGHQMICEVVYAKLKGRSELGWL